MRGYEYLHFLGHKAFHGNLELRFPLVEAMATPIGILGGIRGTFFFNVGAAAIAGQPWNLFSTGEQWVRPVVGYRQNFLQNAEGRAVEPVFGEPTLVSGFRLDNARASYGFGLTTFAIGFPVHLDWAWPTLFNEAWEDVVFATEGARAGFLRGSDHFGKSRFSIWVGYDF